jgi:hypothetical protein
MALIARISSFFACRSTPVDIVRTSDVSDTMRSVIGDQLLPVAKKARRVWHYERDLRWSFFSEDVLASRGINYTIYHD